MVHIATTEILDSPNLYQAIMPLSQDGGTGRRSGLKNVGRQSPETQASGIFPSIYAHLRNTQQIEQGRICEAKYALARVG